jgi:hypothetical protein
MTKAPHTNLARATETVHLDTLQPIGATRHDTGEPSCLVQSRSDPTRHYLLTVNKETIQCPCPQAQHHGICAHAAVVRLALQAEPQKSTASDCPQHIQPPVHQAPYKNPRSAPRREQERQWRAEAELRERALLWTDDRPCSVWKSE